jgi:hypothetical protein
MHLTVQRLSVLAAVTVLAAGTVSLEAIANAKAAITPAVTFTGSVGRLPAASGVVLVEAELPFGRNGDPQHVATYLEDVVVASARISGPAFRITVPSSPTLRHAETMGKGVVNFDLVVDSGSAGTSQYVPVALTQGAEPGNSQAEAHLRSGTTSVPRFPPFRPMSARMRQAIAVAGGLAGMPLDGPYSCTWRKHLGLSQHETKIGQVHVADARGVTDDFKYSVKDDATVTVGESGSSAKGYTVSGSITLTDSLSASGHGTFEKGANKYVTTLMYYQRYKNNGTIQCPPGVTYKLQADHSAGNVDPAKGSSPRNRSSSCRKDRSGSFELPAHYGWSRDRAKSATVNEAATVFHFSESASAGFTNDILQDYEAAAGAAVSYICGNGSLPGVPIIYNTK